MRQTLANVAAGGPTAARAARRALDLTPAPVRAAKRSDRGNVLLSVIVPAYNERERIGASLTAMTDYLTTAGVPYEIIVVSDGSTDGTTEIVQVRQARDSRLRMISCAENHGKGHAVRAGVAAARGRYVMFIDADLTIPIAIVADFLTALESGYDIAIASRRHPASVAVAATRTRRLMGAVFSWCVRRLIVSDIGDTQCGAKAYRAAVARRLFAAQRIDHFSFDAEVLYLARRAGCRVKEVPVALNWRAGSSIRPVRDALLMLRDVLRIRLYARRGVYDRPAQ